MSKAPCCALGHRGDQMCKVPAVTEPTLQCRGEGWVTVNKYTHPVAGGDAFKKIKQAKGTVGDGYGG